jgi:hypothetical protein
MFVGTAQTVPCRARRRNGKALINDFLLLLMIVLLIFPAGDAGSHQLRSLAPTARPSKIAWGDAPGISNDQRTASAEGAIHSAPRTGHLIRAFSACFNTR